MKYKFPVTKLILDRLGRRGIFLLFLTLLDILYGFSLFTNPDSFVHYHIILPLHVWGIVWIGTGLFLLTGVFTNKDRFHFGVACLLKMIWAVSWLDAWMFQGFSRGWVTFVIWAAFAGIVYLIGTWAEAPFFEIPHQHHGRDKDG